MPFESETVESETVESETVGFGQFPVAADYLMALLNMAGTHGISPQACLADSGLDAQIFIKGIKNVGNLSLRAVTNNLLKYFSLEDLTCYFLDHLGVLHHGPLSLAIQSSESLDEALTAVVQYAETRTAGKHLHYTRSKLHHCVTLTKFAAPVEENPTVDRFIVMTTLLSVAKGIVMLLDECDQMAHIIFDFSVDNPKRIMEHFSKFEIQFSGDASALYLPKEVKFVPLIKDRSLFRSAIQACDAHKLVFEGEDAIETRVRFELSRASHPNMSMEDVAAMLCMSPRTLQRKLAVAGTGFRELRAKELHRKALFYLEHSSLSVENIAHTLGFSHPSNFIRSFKEETGASPGEFREKRNVSNKRK